MIRLKKANATEWLGNGFGSSTADWVVAKDPSITVRKSGLSWYAYQNRQRIAAGWSRADLLDNLASKRPELAGEVSA